MNSLKDFLAKNDILLIVGADNEGYNIRFESDINLDEFTDIMVYLIKTAISSIPNELVNNEIAEMKIFQQIEEKIINDDTPYTSDDTDESDNDQDV